MTRLVSIGHIAYLGILLLAAGTGCSGNRLLAERHPYWIGYTDKKCDDPRGR
jgi:hypothetical protein